MILGGKKSVKFILIKILPVAKLAQKSNQTTEKKEQL